VHNIMITHVILHICFLCVAFSALGLRCYVCSSSKSWDDCKTTSHICPNGFDMCSKVYFKNAGIQSFRKYCIPKAGCSKDTDPTCKNAVGSFECQIDCCSTDDCNAGTTVRVSGIMLLTCALAYLMIVAKAWKL